MSLSLKYLPTVSKTEAEIARQIAWIVPWQQLRSLGSGMGYSVLFIIFAMGTNAARIMAMAASSLSITDKPFCRA